MVELSEKFTKGHGLRLYSQAADEAREGIQLIEANMFESSDTLIKMNLHTWFVERKLEFYANLMSIEFDRRNFDDVIKIYENLFERGNIKLKKKILSSCFPTLQLKCHEALLRQGKGNMDTFISLSKSRITCGRKENLENDLRRCADILRMTKHFDEAMVLGKQLAELTGDKVSLATTYLEQYIFGDKSPPGDFIVNVFQKHQNDGFNKNNAASMLVLAQWTYLLHKLDDDKEELLKKAIGFLENYLDLISSIETHCITCTQIAMTSEVQFVCSGCRVACYCSIDHQRMTWKKEAEKGMRFGHEVLCPVMKAYRKWRHANDNSDNGRASTLRQRFERECLCCLSDGLGLRNKCFQK